MSAIFTGDTLIQSRLFKQIKSPSPPSLDVALYIKITVTEKTTKATLTKQLPPCEELCESP